MLGNKVFVMPALRYHIGKQGIEQSGVRAGLDIQVQNIGFSGNLLANRHSRGATGIHDDDFGCGSRFARKALLLFVHAAAVEIGNPVIQKVVGLGFIGVGTRADDGVCQLCVFIAVVQLAHAHIAGGVAFGVVGWPVMDTHHGRL